MALRFTIIQDAKENRRKCTLTPLVGSEGIEFIRADCPRGDPGRIPVGPALLLAVDGPPLEAADAPFAEEHGVVLLDGTWVRVTKLLDRLILSPEVRRRSLPRDFMTAYPRVSKVHRDPDGGLASVEALFAASAVLGSPRPELLRHYHWAREFLDRNSGLLFRLEADFPRGKTALCPGFGRERPPHRE
jgi:pre-rRNA-processing protein TSR3